VATLYVFLSSNAWAAQECNPNKLGQAYQNLPSPWRSTASADLIHTRIGGRDFYVPKNYFRHPQIGCGADEPGMLLRVLLPDLRPYSKETAAEFAAQRGFGNLLNILVTSTPPVRPLNELLEVVVGAGALHSPTRDTHGLSFARDRFGDDVFFSRTGGKVSPLISCRPIRPDRGASCGHHFRFQELDIQLSYGREHLPNWLSIQTSAQNLLDRLNRREMN
jgi:hypothetical protein